MHRFLLDRRETQAAGLVAQAQQFLKDEQFDEAGEALRAAARAADAKSAAHAQGLRNIAGELPETSPARQPPRRTGEDTESLPALDGE
jgi:hypothetical protein